jgi:hypothetical protein
MIPWSFRLIPVFGEIVGLILRSPHPQGNLVHVYMTMEQSAALRVFPDESASLLSYVLRSSTLEWDEPVYQMVRKLAPLVSSKAKLIEVCEELAQKGSPSADTLKKFVQSVPPSQRPETDSV